ncbi:hypothetical protein [Falsiroseomonas sp.]|uniref:hypothetical protein n=1 Tax=Falsiroseomonas sp. TaxID=2870721 RepID=UPI003563EFFA
MAGKRRIVVSTITAVLQGAQGAGLSRLSLPFLAGTFLTGNRRWARVLGFLLYVAGGWIFAFGYFLVFVSPGRSTWWLGTVLGVLHGLVLLAGVLPLLPFLHSRMASEHDGPTRLRQIEPPRFMGLNCGRRTPLTTLVGQIIYGAILGGSAELQAAFG